MSVLTLRPNGDNTNEASEWRNQASATTNIYQSVDEAVLSDTDYATMSAGDVGAEDRDMIYNWPDHTTESGTISQVKLYAQVAKLVNGTGGTGIKLYLFPFSSTSRNEVTVTTSSTQVSVTYANNPVTSSAWTWTDIDNLTAGHAGVATGGDAKNNTVFYVSQMFIEVTYTASGWANIAKINGVASSSVAKVDGVAVASIAKINGVSV